MPDCRRSWRRRKRKLSRSRASCVLGVRLLDGSPVQAGNRGEASSRGLESTSSQQFHGVHRADSAHLRCPAQLHLRAPFAFRTQYRARHGAVNWLEKLAPVCARCLQLCLCRVLAERTLRRLKEVVTVELLQESAFCHLLPSPNLRAGRRQTPHLLVTCRRVLGMIRDLSRHPISSSLFPRRITWIMRSST